MGFLDQISKTISQGVDRAKFEADKFQRTTRIQGEVNDVRRQMDEKMIEMGQRAYDLHRAGQINAPTIAALAQTIDQLRSSLVVKEEELKQAQSDNYIEPSPSYSSSSQSVPIDYGTPSSSSSSASTTPPPPPPSGSLFGSSGSVQATPGMKTCRQCGFQMPGTAVFCPNCGTRSDV
ncbi:MAG: zinc ribbon domain-containing protein [Chloroflexaceae bacterium]|jgi:hypothetical protein|nr:zinc ribbon domain-containing protein [Chloroflexaceae bacterium]